MFIILAEITDDQESNFDVLRHSLAADRGLTKISNRRSSAKIRG